MAEIRDVNPVGPTWPTKPIKPVGGHGQPPKRQPKDKQGNKQQSDDDGKPHVDEYA